MNRPNKWLRIALPLLILIAGIIGMRLLILSNKGPQKVAPAYNGALVELLTVQPQSRAVTVPATGIVQPAAEITLTPQVSGRVVRMAPQLSPGGFFRQGEELFAIDDADYRLAVAKAEAAVSKAEYELATVEGQATIARQEWTQLYPESQEEAPPLVLNQPQVKNARANLAAAVAGLEQARLDLARTRLVAPFDCLVRSEQLDLGQYVKSGTGVALLSGSRQAEIVVPIPLAELHWLTIPRAGSRTVGSVATVRLNAGAENFTWPAKVVRALGEVDPQGRMARVVLALNDPYGLKSAVARQPQLAFGSFVQVTIEGPQLPQVVVLPATALRDGSLVWVADAEMKLQMRPVRVLRREAEIVLIDQGLQAGDKVVLTQLSGAAAGMQLRTTDGEVPR